MASFRPHQAVSSCFISRLTQLLNITVHGTRTRSLDHRKNAAEPTHEHNGYKRKQDKRDIKQRNWNKNAKTNAHQQTLGSGRDEPLGSKYADTKNQQSVPELISSGELDRDTQQTRTHTQRKPTRVTRTNSKPTHGLGTRDRIRRSPTEMLRSLFSPANWAACFLLRRCCEYKRHI